MKFIEFIKSHIKEIKLASITFVVTLAVCFGTFFLINKPEESTKTTSVSSQSTSITYVGSKNSDKYHKPNCRWAENIKNSNKITFSSESAARAKGYTACKTCL